MFERIYGNSIFLFQGMRARDSSLYSNGASVHYSGVNDMLPYWAARKHLYKPTIIHLDDVTVSSTLADSALEANAGMFGRQFSISYQGIKGKCFRPHVHVHVQ